MHIIKNIINADSDYTLDQSEPVNRCICKGRIFTADEDLNGIVSADIINAIAAGDVTVIDYVAPTLDECKSAKKLMIDIKTSILIKSGFPHDGCYFSMSDAAQRNWCALAAAKANGLIAYPFAISTADESSYTVADATALTMFLISYLTYQTNPQSPLASGRTLKALVESCETIAEVNAIEDNR